MSTREQSPQQVSIGIDHLQGSLGGRQDELERNPFVGLQITRGSFEQSSEDAQKVEQIRQIYPPLASFAPDAIILTESQYPNASDLGYTQEERSELIKNPPENFDPSTVLPYIPGTLAVLSAAGGFVSYLDARKKDRNVRKDELAQERENQYRVVVKDLGSDRMGERLSAAIRLKSFLDENEELEENYAKETFDLAVFYLGTRDIAKETPEDWHFHNLMKQLLVISVPIIHKKLQRKGIDLEKLKQTNRDEFLKIRKKYLDASWVVLNGLDFEIADLSYLVLDHASFGPLVPDDPSNYDNDRYYIGSTNLFKANLSNTSLQNANLSRAYCNGASFVEANLHNANLRDASMSNAQFIQAKCEGANLDEIHPGHLKRTEFVDVEFYNDPRKQIKLDYVSGKGAVIN